MKVLIIGSGGREHAIAWKLAQSDAVTRIFVAPGNGGTAGEAKCVNLPIPGGDPAAEKAQKDLAAWARKEKIDLTVVGPEAPLAAGLVDRFRAAGLPIVGPDKNAAQLESSKAFAKSFMEKYGVRTVRSKTFIDQISAIDYAEEHFAQDNPPPLVVKANGLAAGKGVIIALSQSEAENVLQSFMRERTLGEAGRIVVLEDYIEGREVSILAAVSSIPGKAGGTILPFVSARDHKRRFEGGRGPNTGGMGAIAPVPDFTPAIEEDFRRAILEPTLRGMEREGMDYRGFIFFGLMIREDRCFLLEYNVRLGDPETQAVLPLLKSDLGELCLSMLDGSLGSFSLQWESGAVCAPVAVAGGYPSSYFKGNLITIDREELAQTGAQLFIAGATADHVVTTGGQANVSAGYDRDLYTAGGRVLAISAWGADEEDARARAYKAIRAVRFNGMAFRRDIGRE
ncbi:MAG: phosphoribosylamine--glycine ligase [Spirochaetaceae bacterium]|jgi:phosphoribosylamine--glycine ligase|nr:phosphoribosylamine--glycine ligase [Spirochaetaceae bacterium]